jgi:hypothetical protein
MYSHVWGLNEVFFARIFDAATAFAHEGEQSIWNRNLHPPYSPVAVAAGTLSSIPHNMSWLFKEL